MKSDTEILTEYQCLERHEDPDGIVGAGICMLLGVGIRKDPSRAFDYFKTASKRPHHSPKATNNYALCFLLGIGTNVDNDKACKLLKKSAEHGDDVAKVNWVHCMLMDFCDLTDPRRLLREACLKNCPEAHFLLSVCYHHGLGGIEKDSEKGKQEARLAKDLGFKCKERAGLADVYWFFSYP